MRKPEEEEEPDSDVSRVEVAEDPGKGIRVPLVRDEDAKDGEETQRI